MIISENIDKNTISTDTIMYLFSCYLYNMDSVRLTQEQYIKIEKMLEENPILRILCYAMLFEGAKDFIYKGLKKQLTNNKIYVIIIT